MGVWSTPSSACSTHTEDAIVFCASGEPGFTEGTLRLIAADGAPAPTGRLEVYLDGFWGSVCQDGFAAGSASVACKQMGYKITSAEPTSCASAGEGFCGPTQPHMSQLACA